MTPSAFDLLAGGKDAPALLDGARTLTRGRAREICDDIARFLGDDAKKLVMVENPRSAAGALAYLAALRAGHAVMLVETAGLGDLPASIERMRPDVVLGPSCVRATETSADYRREAENVPHIGPARRVAPARATEPSPELALVARTSGSMSEGKLVRLSYGNLSSNAHSIGRATGIRPTDVAATSLRLDYSFGLSVFNSHLAAGAAVALTTASPTTGRFWTDARRLGVTTIGMVPSTVPFVLGDPQARARLSSLRAVLVAGGPLSAPSLRRLRAAAGPRTPVFYMYGQTEATARMTCLDPALAAVREGSVGAAIPGGRIEIRGRDGAELAPGQRGEVHYTGPNVMLGYARARDDLALPDLTGGELRTGDVGRMEDGVLYLEGRLDRQVKVLGERVGLDAVEAAAMTALDGTTVAAVLAKPDEVHIYVEGDADRLGRLRSLGSAGLGVPRGCLKLHAVHRLPRTPSGKVKYVALS
ncbi:AMP-binding protein [Streptomyces sp. 130]|uniref:AMP-binding protein n=1 Tax=Streptomyces sp. 130 TaxID=2591006 RepID=UPI00117C1798|nr:AMP-binding protein [Streptomyces sp. 130]TRV80941.1 AMP-binding protein [Streptomyces sp. 130]